MYIGSTRFNNETLEENYNYRIQKNIKGCIYGSCMMINEKYPVNSTIFVIEMNNTTNEIAGIGLIKNRIKTDKKYKIYEEGNFNGYTYGGNFWISREQISQCDPEIIEIFDKILFKGKSNLKRISGISVVTDKLFQRWEYDGSMILRQINRMFVEIFQNEGVEKEIDF